MAFTIYEYPNVIDGAPALPYGRRQAGTPGTVYTLDATTQYAAVVSDADMYLRVSADGTSATSADHKLKAGETYGFRVRKGDTPKVHGLAA